MEGAVLVELMFGNRPVHPMSQEYDFARREVCRPTYKLQDAVITAVGSAIPESTTLIFYGPDAEAIFKILSRHWTSEQLRWRESGDRPGDAHREVVIPREPNALI